MKQDQRSIVRKRTQQLVYLELGRDNGGVMLNLSEDGCSFQAITPVKCGEARFAFQISGGRRISGEAEVVWVDDVGIMGGLRFLNLPVEARKQIRQWLQETNAPEERGTFEAAPAAPLGAAARTEARVEASAAWSSREHRSTPSPTGVRTVEEEAPPPPTAWANLRAASVPPLHEEQFSVPLLSREDAAFVAPRARSVAMWRALAVLATAVAIALLLVNYQHEVGDSLIWLGETLSGKTKASVVVPDSKTTPPSTSTDSGTPVASGGVAGTSSSEIGAATQKPEEQKTEDAVATQPKPTIPDSTVAPVNQSARLETSSTGVERQESVLEKQQVVREKPEAWDSNESVESLWGAVQGGSVSAERSLAERFARGEGVVKNCEQAKVLLKAAANRGSREARLRLYELETQGCH
jgi:hypothetical protein